MPFNASGSTFIFFILFFNAFMSPFSALPLAFKDFPLQKNLFVAI